jgi:hypothetical protein
MEHGNNIAGVGDKLSLREPSGFLGTIKIQNQLCIVEVESTIF